ncbi:MAG: substrate-binding domain-containing protein, partial [Propionibacteriaceae bacterium]|nr:substrate-binding domain-containing protein [Propionibacteriaceae bacterium]
MTKKTLRKIVALAAVLPLAFAFSSCTTGVDDPKPPADSGIPRPEACDAETPYIAVALPNLTNPYYIAMKRGFEEAGAAAGFDVEVQIANDDDQVQLNQALTMLQKKPCAFALNAVKSEPGAAIVKAANDAGVPVFTVNVILSQEALDDQGAVIVQY